jgi:hypothetical protein
MKWIFASIPLFVASYFLMRWFNHTDQGRSGKQLGLDAPAEMLADGWPMVAGWTSILAFFIAVGLLAYGINEVRQNRRIKRRASHLDRFGRQVVAYMNGETKGFGVNRHSHE